MKKTLDKLKKYKWPTWLGVVLLLIFALLHLNLVSKTFVIDDRESIHSTIEGFGDTPLHLTQISKFAYNPKFDLNDPIFLEEKLHYPFLVNLFSGLLLRFTGWFTFSVVFPIYFLVIANLLLLILIYNKLFKNLLLTAVSVWMFMLGSGISGLTYLFNAVLQQRSLGLIIQDILDKGVHTIVFFEASYPAQNINFGAPLSLVLIHQRAFLLGLSGFLVFLYLILLFETQPLPTWKRTFLLGLPFGLLPLMHTHSFVAASLVLAAYGLILLWGRQWSKFKRLLITAIGGSIIALPQLWYLVGTKSLFSSAGSFTRFRLGFMVEPGIGAVQYPTDAVRSVFSWAYLSFMSVNFGLIFFLFILCLVIFLFRKKLRVRVDNNIPSLFLLSSVIIFFVVQTVQFQPWDFDSNKLLLYYQLFSAPFILWLLSEIFKTKKMLLGVLTVTIFIGATLTGFMDIAPRVAAREKDLPVIFDDSARHLADFVIKTLPDQLILTSTTHLNPISSLSGRGVLLGYPGWLWTRGLNYSDRENEIKQFYQDPEQNSGILIKYSVGYVLLDLMAEKDYGADRKIFDGLFDKIFEDGQYVLYRVK